MNTVNKVFTCLCLSNCACCVACAIDSWIACESSGLACLECGSCCWTVCAPICLSCQLGSCSTGMDHCIKGVKHCLYSCVMDTIAPVDGCYNCVKYIMAICGSGVTGFGDIMKDVKWIANMVKDGFKIENGN